MRHNQMVRRRYNAAQAASRAADGSTQMDHDALPQGPPLSGPPNLPNPNSSHTSAILHSTRQTTSRVRNKVGCRNRQKIVELVTNNTYNYYYTTKDSIVGQDMTVPPPLVENLAANPKGPALSPLVEKIAANPQGPANLPRLMDLQLVTPGPRFDVGKYQKERLDAKLARASQAAQPTPQVPSTSNVDKLGEMDLILWGSSHLMDKSLDKSGLPEQVKKGLSFKKVWDFSEGGKALTTKDTQVILDWIGANGSTRQIYLFLMGGNNIRNAFKHRTDRYKEITAVVRRYKDILESIQRVGARVILCGTVPDPTRQEVDEVLKDLDLALGSLDLGPLGTFLELRSCLTGQNGQIRLDTYRRKDIHLLSVGNAMVGRKIRSLLKVIGKAPSGPSMTQTKVLPTAPALVRAPGPASKQTGVRAPVVPPQTYPTPPILINEKEVRLAELWAELRGSPLPPPNFSSTSTALALLPPPIQNLDLVAA